MLASEKQIALLQKLGYTGDLTSVTKEEASAFINAAYGGSNQQAAPQQQVQYQTYQAPTPNPVEVAPTPTPNQIQTNPAKDVGQLVVKNMLNQVMSFAEIESTNFSDKDKQYAVSIITATNKQLVASQTTWQQLDIVGCGFVQQVKRFSKLGLTTENQEIWIETRNNKNKAGMKDIAIKLQYQGLEKLMMKFCSKKIVRFVKDVVCVDDEFETTTDFETGVTKITKHNKFQSPDVDYRNKLENIVAAYQIAYVEEYGKVVPYMALVDKNRIERARTSATSQNVWGKDVKKMVIKTATWELYNVLRPFMNMPQDLVSELNDVSNDEVDFSNKEYANQSTSQVASQQKQQNASKPIDFNYDFETGEIK